MSRVVRQRHTPDGGGDPYGRVVGLGDRVELQPDVWELAGQEAPNASRLQSSRRPPLSPAVSGPAIDNVLQRYRIECTDADRATLMRAARSAADPEAMGLAGAMFEQAGLAQTATAKAMYRAQLASASRRRPRRCPTRDPSPGSSAPGDRAPSYRRARSGSWRDLLGSILESKMRRLPRRSPEASRQRLDSRRFNIPQPAADGSPPPMRITPKKCRSPWQPYSERPDRWRGGATARACFPCWWVASWSRCRSLCSNSDARQPGAGPSASTVLFSLQTQQWAGGCACPHYRRTRSRADHDDMRSGRPDGALRGSAQRFVSESGWNVDEVPYGVPRGESAQPVVAVGHRQWSAWIAELRLV